MDKFDLSIMHFTFRRFKQEVSAGLQREKSLEQNKAQLQLDWEARMEDVERKAYGKHQDIIQQLIQAKDKVGISSLQFTVHIYTIVFTVS